MVADKVTVLSRPAGDPDDGVRWESDGQGEFTVETVDKDRRGTDVILHLKEEEKEFLEPYRAAADRQEVLRLHRASRRHGRGEGGGRQEDDRRGDAQLAQGDLAAHEVGGHAGGVQRVLQADRQRLRPTRPASSTTPPRGPTSSACWCSSRRTGRWSCSGASSRRACGCTSSASSSWTTARSCCRRTCASSRAWSIRPTCR